MSKRLEAIAALEDVIARLADAKPIAPLDRRLLAVTTAHAKECVESIEELKRPRRKSPADRGEQ